VYDGDFMPLIHVARRQGSHRPEATRVLRAREARHAHARMRSSSCFSQPALQTDPAGGAAIAVFPSLADEDQFAIERFDAATRPDRVWSPWATHCMLYAFLLFQKWKTLTRRACTEGRSNQYLTS
jgi:hypothetical protein